MIKCENVTIKYDGFVAVRDVSFSVFDGDWLCIMGENGAGKSSIVKAMLSLCPINGGKIEGGFDGGAGYVPQMPPVQEDFPASVYEIVLSGFVKKAGLFYTAAQKREAISKMSLLGIENLKNACFRELSGGQRQRVMLSRALCAGGGALFLDEPCTGLDAEAEENLYGILMELNKKGTTIIMISHDSENALKYANKILCLTKDRYFFGDTETFIKEQERGNGNNF